MKIAWSEKSLLWLVAIGFFMQTLDATVVNTALPAMAQSLRESPLQMQSVIIAYSLAMAMLIPLSGWLADRMGTRTTYVGAILVFVTGSVLCALSTSLYLLVLARVIQGAGGAMLMPVGRLAVLRAFPPPRFLAAMSFVTVPGLVGPLLGPTLGGWLTQVASWHWIFWINLPIGILGVWVALRAMPNTRLSEKEPFDTAGYFWVATGMASCSLAFEGLSELKLPSSWVWSLFTVGFGSLVIYARHATHAPRPLFSPAILRVPSFAIGLLGNAFSRLGNGGMPFLLPLLLQVSLGYSPTQSGMSLIPVALAAMVAKRWIPRLIGRFGYRQVLIFNTLALGLGIASFALVTPEQPLALRILQLAFYGAANSLQFSSMNTVVLRDLTPAQGSEGNTLLSMAQMLAMGLGTAVMGALLSGFRLSFASTPSHSVLAAFHATFICAGLLTALSALIFARLVDNKSLG